MKRIVIIGGGVAGLAVGVLLQKRGYATTICEKEHEIGGLCTSWRRGDYTFNGCLHWILGVRDGISFYHFWKELFDIDKVPFHFHRERVAIEDNEGRTFHLLNDIDEFQSYLIDIAPEDTKAIHQWCDAVRFILPHLKYLPPVWRESEPWYRGLCWKSKMITLLPMLFFMLRWGRLSNKQFAQRFKNEYLRRTVETLYSNEMRMTVLLFAQAYATKRVAGYPIGGSLTFVKHLEKEFLKHGGDLRKGTSVNTINTTKGKNGNDIATGVTLHNGTTLTADIVISAADWTATTFGNETMRGLDGRYATPKEKAFQHPPKEAVFYSFCMLHLGVNMPLTDYAHYQRFPVRPITSPDGTTYDEIEVHIYNYDPSLAPQGKTAMSVNLHTREGMYWIDQRHNNITRYKADKEYMTEQLIERLTEHFGKKLTDNIEVKDLSTPATYHRYTGNYAGSSQGWTPMNNILKSFVVRPTQKGLKNFYHIGHWTKAGGGVPVAIHSAREIVRKIVYLADETER